MASVKDFSVEEKLVNLYRLQRVDSSITNGGKRFGR